MKKGKLALGLSLLSLLVAVLTVFSACGTPATTTTTTPAATTTTGAGTVATGAPIKVGITTPSTGPAAEKGAPIGHGNLDAIEYINAELNGINGYKMQAVWLDSQYDPAKVVTNMKYFMDQGAVIWGTASSKEGTAAMELANRNGFPGLVSFTSPILYRPPQHVYGQLPDYGDDALAFADYYMKNVWKGRAGKPKFAVMILNNPTGFGARDAFEAKAADMGIEMVKPYYEHSDTDVSMMSALTSIKNVKPDVIYISSTPRPTALIIKEAVALGLYPGVTIASGHAGLTKVLVDTDGADVVEGVYGVFPTASWTDDVPGMAKMTEYAKRLHPGDVGNMDYITGWTQSLVMAEAIRNAVKTAGYDVVAKGDAASWKAVETQGLQTLKDYKVGGLHGPVTYVAGDNRLAKSVRVFQIKKGVITAITEWIDAPLVKYETYPWFGK